MKQKRQGLLSIFVLAAVLATACQPAAQTGPQPTAQVINPSEKKAAEATKPAEETKPAEATKAEATAAPEATKAESATKTETGNLVVNGVTLPFPHSQAIVMDQTNFTIFDSFNPWIPNGLEFAAGWYQISNEYLWYVNYATGEIIPWLAQKHEYNKDYTELRISIKNDAKWNDGEPFTANDVVYTFQMRAKDPAALGNPDPDGVVADVSAPDDLTVLYKFKSPQPRYHLGFWCTICTGATIIPKHIWEKQDPKTFKNNPPVTTGPYMLEKVYAEQKVFVWKKNPNYWNKAAFDPAPQYVVYRTGPTSPDAAIADMEAGNTDILGAQYDLVQGKGDALKQFNSVAYVDPCPRAVWFNNAKAPFDKPEFRRAMSMVMNRDKWAKNIWVPPSKPAKGLWADYRNMDQYINTSSADKWGTFKYDPDAALKLLESAGYKKDGNTLKDASGNPVKFTVGTPVASPGFEYLIAQDWIEDLKGIGIEANLQNFDGSVWWPKVDNGDWEAGVWWFCGATVDPVELYQQFTCDRVVDIGVRPTNGNNIRACSKEFDAIVQKLKQVTPDDPQAKDLYQQAFDKWMEQAFGVPLIETYYPAQFNTTNWNNMPSADNLYTVPFNWWGQIMWVLFNIKPK